MGRTVTRGEVAALYGVTKNAVALWEKRGLQTRYPGGRGRGKQAFYDLDLVGAWVARHGAGLRAQVNSTDPSSLGGPTLLFSRLGGELKAVAVHLATDLIIDGEEDLERAAEILYSSSLVFTYLTAAIERVAGERAAAAFDRYAGWGPPEYARLVDLVHRRVAVSRAKPDDGPPPG